MEESVRERDKTWVLVEVSVRRFLTSVATPDCKRALLPRNNPVEGASEAPTESSRSGLFLEAMGSGFDAERSMGLRVQMDVTEFVFLTKGNIFVVKFKPNGYIVLGASFLHVRSILGGQPSSFPASD